MQIQWWWWPRNIPGRYFHKKRVALWECRLGRPEFCLAQGGAEDEHLDDDDDGKEVDYGDNDKEEDNGDDAVDDVDDVYDEALMLRKAFSRS